MEGSYILLIHCPRDVVIRTRARVFEILRGHYLYIGSCGSGCHRVLRHLGFGRKKLFWHIDYLLEQCIPERALILRGISEKALAQAIDRVLSLEPIEGFGSSDDPGARSHLFRAKDSLEEILEGIITHIEGLRSV